MVLFSLGLVSTAVTFVPGLGFPPVAPGVLRYLGICAMASAFLAANYRLYATDRREVAKLTTELQKQPVEIRESDEDLLRKVLLKYWKDWHSSLARNLPADHVARDLGWPIDRLEVAALKVTGNFGTLKVSFDGHTFQLQRIPC